MKERLLATCFLLLDRFSRPPVGKFYSSYADETK